MELSEYSKITYIYLNDRYNSKIFGQNDIRQILRPFLITIYWQIVQYL